MAVQTTKEAAAKMAQETEALEKEIEADNKILEELTAEAKLDDECIEKLKAINANEKLTPEEKKKQKDAVVAELDRKVKALKQQH